MMVVSHDHYEGEPCTDRCIVRESSLSIFLRRLLGR